MHPYLCASLPVYPAALALAVITSALIGAQGLRRLGLARRACMRVQLALAVAGLLGGKLNSILERGGALLPFRHELTQGYRYPGAAAGVILVLAVFGAHITRGASLAALGDAVAPSIGIGSAVSRLGCVLSGCCFGVQSDVLWAVRFPAQTPVWHAHLAGGLISPASRLSLPVHPLQIYFMLLSLCAAGIAWAVHTRSRTHGQTLLVFLAIDGLGRALLEELRAEPPPHIQLASFLIGASAGVLLVRMRSQRPRCVAASASHDTIAG